MSGTVDRRAFARHLSHQQLRGRHAVARRDCWTSNSNIGDSRMLSGMISGIERHPDWSEADWRDCMQAQVNETVAVGGVKWLAEAEVHARLPHAVGRRCSSSIRADLLLTPDRFWCGKRAQPVELSGRGRRILITSVAVECKLHATARDLLQAGRQASAYLRAVDWTDRCGRPIARPSHAAVWAPSTEPIDKGVLAELADRRVGVLRYDFRLANIWLTYGGHDHHLLDYGGGDYMWGEPFVPEWLGGGGEVAA